MVSITSQVGRITRVENFTQENIQQKVTDSDTSIEGFSTFIDGNGRTDQKYFNNNPYQRKIYKPLARFNNKSDYLYSVYTEGPSMRYTTYTEDFVLNTATNPYDINTWTRSATIGSSVFNTVYTGSTKTFVRTSPLNRTMTYKWDSYQRPTSFKRGNLTATTFTYTNDKLTKITQGSRITNLSYYATSGLLQSVVNPLSQTTSYAYDNAEKLTSMTLPDSRVVSFVYNSNGKLASITPASRPIHSFGYNVAELVGNYTPPVLGGVPIVATQYFYNTDKQLTQIQRPDGQTVDFGFNPASGQITTLTTPQRVINFGYLDTAAAKPVRTMNYSGGSLRFEFSAKMLESLKSTYSDGQYSVYSYTTDMTYHGYLKSETLHVNGTNSVINFGYDSDELLTSAGSLTLAYDVPNGQLNGTTLGTITDANTYNTVGELLTHKGKIGSTNSYAYTLTRDSLGRVATKSQTIPGYGTNNYVYRYDTSGRLDQVTKNSAIVAVYGYDNNNNRVSGNIGLETTTGVYDNQDRLTNYNAFQYAYNANGDLQSKTNTLTSEVTSYTYDALGNLTKVILPNTTVITYEVDGINRRVGKSVNGVLQRRYVYLDQYRIGAEVNPDGSILRRYVYASKSNIPDYYIQNGENYKIFSDHLGSPRMVVKEATGATVCVQDHDEFGRVILNTVPGCVVFGFAGGLYDHDTGLVRFGARDYDPTIGRWTTKDPIGFKGGDTNLYAYVGGNPMSYIDPMGLSQEQLDKGYAWLSTHYPFLIPKGGVSVRDSKIPTYAGMLSGGNVEGVSIPFLSTILIDTTGMTDSDVVGMLAHELFHYNLGTLKNALIMDDKRHDLLEGFFQGTISNSYNTIQGISNSKRGDAWSCKK